MSDAREFFSRLDQIEQRLTALESVAADLLVICETEIKMRRRREELLEAYGPRQVYGELTDGGDELARRRRQRLAMLANRLD